MSFVNGLLQHSPRWLHGQTMQKQRLIAG